MFRWAGGRSYRGYWREGKQHGLGIYTRDGVERKGEWANGTRVRWISEEDAETMNFDFSKT